MQDHIDVFWAELPIQNNFKIEGEKPVVTGFRSQKLFFPEWFPEKFP